jgi:hypothetical protein
MTPVFERAKIFEALYRETTVIGMQDNTVLKNYTHSSQRTLVRCMRPAGLYFLLCRIYRLTTMLQAEMKDVVFKKAVIRRASPTIGNLCLFIWISSGFTDRLLRMVLGILKPTSRWRIKVNVTLNWTQEPIGHRNVPLILTCLFVNVKTVINIHLTISVQL